MAAYLAPKPVSFDINGVLTDIPQVCLFHAVFYETKAFPYPCGSTIASLFDDAIFIVSILMLAVDFQVHM